MSERVSVETCPTCGWPISEPNHLPAKFSKRCSNCGLWRRRVEVWAAPPSPGEPAPVIGGLNEAQRLAFNIRQKTTSIGRFVRRADGSERERAAAVEAIEFLEAEASRLLENAGSSAPPPEEGLDLMCPDCCHDTDDEGRCLACEQMVMVTAKEYLALARERDAYRENLRLRARIEALEGEIEDLRGGDSVGPNQRCGVCNRRMVWDTHERDCPVWMCPRCVHRRMTDAERARRLLEGGEPDA